MAPSKDFFFLLTVLIFLCNILSLGGGLALSPSTSKGNLAGGSSSFGTSAKASAFTALHEEHRLPGWLGERTVESLGGLAAASKAAATAASMAAAKARSQDVHEGVGTAIEDAHAQSLQTEFRRGSYPTQKTANGDTKPVSRSAINARLEALAAFSKAQAKQIGGAKDHDSTRKQLVGSAQQIKQLNLWAKRAAQTRERLMPRKTSTTAAPNTTLAWFQGSDGGVVADGVYGGGDSATAAVQTTTATSTTTKSPKKKSREENNAFMRFVAQNASWSTVEASAILPASAELFITQESFHIAAGKRASERLAEEANDDSAPDPEDSTGDGDGATPSTTSRTTRRASPVNDYTLLYRDAYSPYKAEYKFSSDVYRMLPSKGGRAFQTDGTCAVVGNGGSLLRGPAMGKEIDAHKHVFRINLAPVTNYEERVGRRTDFEVVNARHLEDMLFGHIPGKLIMSNIRYRLPHRTLGSGGRNFKTVMFETTVERFRTKVVPFLLQRRDFRPMLMHPSAVETAVRVWHHARVLIENELLDEQDGSSPSKDSAEEASSTEDGDGGVDEDGLVRRLARRLVRRLMEEEEEEAVEEEVEEEENDEEEVEEEVEANEEEVEEDEVVATEEDMAAEEGSQIDAEMNKHDGEGEIETGTEEKDEGQDDEEDEDEEDEEQDTPTPSSPRHLFNKKPMSGLFAFFLALQLCKGGVHLYGFEAWTGEGKYHYFDAEAGFQDRHSFDLAIEVFKRVASTLRSRTVTLH